MREQGIDLATEVIRRALRAGADEVEAYFQEREITTIELRDGELSSLAAAVNRGIGIRALVADSSAYVYTDDLRPRSLADFARRVVALARESAPDPDRRLPDLPDSPSDQDLQTYDPALAEVTPDQKIALLQRIDRAAREADSRVQTVELVRYVDSAGSTVLANSKGRVGSFLRGKVHALAVVIARDGEASLRGYGSSSAHSFDDLEPELVAQQAARRAVKPLGGKAVPTQRATIVMEPEVVFEFLNQVAAALSGDSVLRARSMFAGRLGERVGSDLVTLVDQGNLLGGLASQPFDAEGVPTQRTVLVEGGVLRSYMHNTYSARRSGTTSTGNAARAGFRTGPDLGPSNFWLEAPSTPLRDLFAGVERGLYVLMTRNVGGINPVNGDYSVGASGVWLENGQEVGPVSGVTIASNMRDMLASITAAGDDLRWSGNAIGSPTLRVEGMTIAGE